MVAPRFSKQSFVSASDEVVDITALQVVAQYVIQNSVAYNAQEQYSACIWPQCGVRVYGGALTNDVPHTDICPVLMARVAIQPITPASAPDTGKGAE